MSQAREAILGRLRQSTAKPLVPKHSMEESSPKYASKREQVTAFTAALELAHAEVKVCYPSNLQANLQQIISGRPYSRWACANDSFLIDLIETAHVDHQPASVTLPDGFEITSKTDLFHSVSGALTRAKAGFAETGTLVLMPGVGEPRSYSLVPPVHVVLIEASDLYDSFTHWLFNSALTRETIPTNIVFVSGPSKTADIQQTLAYGAHGPKELIVLLLVDEDF